MPELQVLQNERDERIRQWRKAAERLNKEQGERRVERKWGERVREMKGTISTLFPVLEQEYFP